MKAASGLNEVNRVEILTLQDNYIDITAADNSAVVTRARLLVDGGVPDSIVAEHGFSAIVRTTKGGEAKTMLFDFGYSESGAARNARILHAATQEVEVMVLSHGHYDHFGGFENLTRMVNKKGVKLVVHPAVFKRQRYIKVPPDLKVRLPAFTRERVEKAGIGLVETERPCLLLNGDVLFLGEIERKTEFEKGMPNACFKEGGVEKWDPIEDDSSIAVNLKGKGLVILSGCAHSGIINTVNYARNVTGIDKVHVVMGGFHLSGPFFEPIIGRTVEEIKKINPTYIIPCHCTGRKASICIESEMPDRFILNMAGTKLTWGGDVPPSHPQIKPCLILVFL